MKKIFFTFFALIGVGAVLFGVLHYVRREAREERQFVVSISEQWEELVPLATKEALPEGVRHFVQQPFFFLGRGRQTSVFLSADGSCVLKLFRDAEKKRKKRRLKESLLGAALARSRISNETGLLFCSLGGIKEKSVSVMILTKKGKVEKINLSSTPFLLQRRALPLKEVLLRMRAEGNVNQAKECVRSLFDLLVACRKKQVADRDGSLIRNGNIGLVGTQAVLLDTGKLCILTDSRRHTLHDLNRLKPLYSWCRDVFPELLPTLKECRKKYAEE